MRSPRSRNAAPSSPSEDDRCRAGGGVGGVATGDDAARGGIDSSAGAPPRLRRSRANGVFAARLCGVDVRLGGVGASDGGGAATSSADAPPEEEAEIAPLQTEPDDARAAHVYIDALGAFVLGLVLGAYLAYLAYSRGTLRLPRRWPFVFESADAGATCQAEAERPLRTPLSGDGSSTDSLSSLTSDQDQPTSQQPLPRPLNDEDALD